MRGGVLAVRFHFHGHPVGVAAPIVVRVQFRRTGKLPSRSPDDEVGAGVSPAAPMDFGLRGIVLPRGVAAVAKAGRMWDRLSAKSDPGAAVHHRGSLPDA